MRCCIVRQKIALLLCALLIFSLVPVSALAADEGTFVLMNIPYADFYAAETGETSLDAVTSATKNKPRTGTLAGGS